MMSRSDLQMIRQGLRNGWDVPESRWREAIGGAVGILKDANATDRERLAALGLVVDSVAFGRFDTQSELQAILGGRGAK